MSGARRTDSLEVLAGKVPHIPLSVRSVEHISIAEFEAMDADGEHIGRVDTDDLTVLYFHQGTVVLSKVGKVALKHWLKVSNLPTDKA